MAGPGRTAQAFRVGDAVHSIKDSDEKIGIKRLFRSRQRWSHETAIYMLEGVAEFLRGPNLEFKDRVEAGDYVYIPAGVPHNSITPPTNRRALIARTDPNEQESVVLI
jgi:uncharacterized RmlC-like cupin family protein